MENKKSEKIIPDQKIGSELDTRHEVRAKSEQEARKIFQLAIQRLLDVNSWDKICGPMSSVFRLTDASGNETKRHAEPGDHFKIDVPGPGPATGDGFDWVEIEALEEKLDPVGTEESVTMRVRPAPNPLNNDKDTAHFFSAEATSSFRVRRNGDLVSAEVHGRNEKPNTDTDKTLDNVRNAVVGTGAVAGMSNPQWKSLVNGLLDTSESVA